MPYAPSQASIFDILNEPDPLPDLHSYDHVICAFSGGKDSVACVLHLLDQGIRPELWHHEIDGRDGQFMDWPITPGYCRAFADAFGLDLYFSWREGGFKRELLKENDRTAPVHFETPDGTQSAGGVRGKIATRHKFPAVVADLRTRWCSAVLKIDVCAIAINNQARFHGKRILVVTGERAQESASRSRYKTLEQHRTHAPSDRIARHVDQWRPIHKWTEKEVWDIIKRYKVNPHPSYRLGFGRTSCLFCIFQSNNQAASGKLIAPDQFEEIAQLEKRFNHTIKANKSIRQQADAGKAYEMKPEVIKVAMGSVFSEPIILDIWTLPAGAYGENAGPT